MTSSILSLYGREASVASWARLSLDAATNCIARVICLMFLTAPIRRRMSRWLAMTVGTQTTAAAAARPWLRCRLRAVAHARRSALAPMLGGALPWVVSAAESHLRQPYARKAWRNASTASVRPAAISSVSVRVVPSSSSTCGRSDSRKR